MIRPLRLVSIAFEAEKLRRRHQVSRAAVRIALTMVGSLLMIGAVVFGHAAIWYWLRGMFNHQQAALIIVGGDLVLALVIGGSAALSKESHIERGARAVRDRALLAARQPPRIAAFLMQTAPVSLPAVARRIFRRQNQLLR